MQPLELDNYFHVYNRANGSEKLFLHSEHYRFFLQRYRQLVGPFVNTLSYCLMPNHFHMLIQVKSEKEIAEWLSTLKKTAGSKTFPKSEKTFEKFTEDPHLVVSKQFSNFFSSYTQAFNKEQHRMGSLFMKNFKRILVRDEDYLINLVHYIHLNPVDAGICDSPGDWKHSSYNEIVKNESRLTSIETLMHYFGKTENFIRFHKLSRAGGFEFEGY